MFVLSVKTTRRRVFILVILVILALVLTGVIISGFGTEANTLMVGGVEYSLKAGDNQDRRTFLRQFGWDCSDEPVELVDVRIPSEFNDVYTTYNELQKKQGFDLEKYKGIRVKRCVYDIFNYPGEEKGVRANLLIYKGLIIGGDISSVALDGFMHGFSEGNPSLAPSQSSGNTSLAVEETQGEASLAVEETQGDAGLVVEETQVDAREQASSEKEFKAASHAVASGE